MLVKDLARDLKRRNSDIFIKQTKPHMAQVLLRSGGYADYVKDKLEDNPNVFEYKNGKKLTLLGCHYDKFLMTIPFPNIYPQKFPCLQEPIGLPKENEEQRYLTHRSYKDVYKELKLMELI